MKKIISLVLCFMFVLMLPLGALAQDKMYVVSKNGKGVNLRQGPSSKDAILVTVPYGKQVVIVELLAGSSWANVEYEGHYGYMMMRYLTYDKPGPKPNPDPSPTKNPDGGDEAKLLKKVFKGFEAQSYNAMVVPSTPTNFVNMRWAPTTSAPVRAQFWAGNVVQVLSKNGSWSEIYDASSNTHGFMMSKFLSKVEIAVGDGIVVQ